MNEKFTLTFLHVENEIKVEMHACGFVSKDNK